MKLLKITDKVMINLNSVSRIVKFKEEKLDERQPYVIHLAIEKYQEGYTLKYKKESERDKQYDILCEKIGIIEID